MQLRLLLEGLAEEVEEVAVEVIRSQCWRLSIFEYELSTLLVAVPLQ